MRSSIPYLLIGVSFLFVSACSDSNDAGVEEDKHATQKVESNEAPQSVQSPVLAKVNNEEITQADVDFLIERTFSSFQQLNADDQLREKVLQSLVASKAMKQSVIKDLSSDELSAIKRRINAYGEELYVKEYLARNASPVPVSTKMVQDYYDSHLEEFGGGESRVFEMLRTSNTPTEQQRDQILDAVKGIKAEADWSTFAEQNKEALGLVFQRSTMQPGLLNPSIESALKALKQNEVSNVVLVDGKPHLLRLIEIKERAPESLSSVSANIRKKLSAIQLKKAVKNAADEVVKKAAVVITE